MKVGVLAEDGREHHPHAGTPQGGILSPLLANLALTHLDDHFRERWAAHGGEWNRRRYRKRGGATFRLVRYADDFVIMVNGARHHVDALWDEVADVLDGIGLRLAPEKTQVVHIDEGFDFLGFRIQRHRQWGSDRCYVYSYPSKKSMKTIRGKVKDVTTRQNTHQSPNILFARLNRITRGWVNYHRHGAAKTAFADLQNYLWRRTWTWLQHKHPTRGRKWIVQRYYRPGWWPRTDGVDLFKPASQAIQRHRYRGNKIPTPWTHTTKPTPT